MLKTSEQLRTEGWRECWGLIDDDGAWLVQRSLDDTDMRKPPFGVGWRRMIFWRAKPLTCPYDFLTPRRFWLDPSGETETVELRER